MDYVRSLSGDFGGVLNPEQFRNEVNMSSITETCIMILNIGDDVTITFDGTLDPAEETTLDGLVSSHVPAVVEPQDTGDVLTATSSTTEAWLPPSGGGGLPDGDEVSASNLVTTTSGTHVQVPGMLFSSPTAGTYHVIFTASVSGTSNGQDIYTQIHVAGVAQNVEMRWERSFLRIRGVLVAVAEVTVNGSQDIQGFWRTSTGTASVEGRSMLLIEVQP